jgi:O-antigen/teichoic acid export membrane protein
MFFNAALLIRNRTGLIGGIALLTAAVNVGANTLLVPHFLAGGAAAARVIALAVMAGTTFAVAQRIWPQRPDLVALAKVSGSALVLYLAARQLPPLTLPVAVAVKALLVLALVGLSVWWHAIDRNDLIRGWRLVRERLRGRQVDEAMPPAA